MGLGLHSGPTGPASPGAERLADRSQPHPFGIIGFDLGFLIHRARTDRRLSASLSTSGRLQKAKRTRVRPSSG
jgi:hypothetical protein